MKQILPDKVYEVLKYLCIIAFPALEEFIPKLFSIWNIPLGDEIAKTLNAIAVLIGSLICVSVIGYNAQKKKEDINNYDTDELRG